MTGTLAHIEDGGAQWLYDAEKTLFTRYEGDEQKGSISAADIPDPDTFNTNRNRPVNETVAALWRF